MIRCGNCGGSHETTKQVRECYQTPAVPMITPNQLGYLQSLVGSRVTPDGIGLEMLDGLTRVEASQLIETMLAQPFQEMDSIIPADIYDGRYAFIDADNNPKFYRVATDKQGKRKVQRVHGAPGDFRYTRVGMSEAMAVINIIKHDPMMHSVMFGYVVGACGICGSPLTDPTSIERGIGPVCASKYGW